jgi:predicted HNH restriction endonuclease
MLRSCKYCGRIHDSTYQCPNKPVYNKRYQRNPDVDSFRNTTKWRKKSLEIRKRDKGLCQVCIRKLYNTIQQYSFDVSVHHIIPLHENIYKGLSSTNLITVCRMHHDMCEDGSIPREIQQSIAKEQEQTTIL